MYCNINGVNVETGRNGVLCYCLHDGEFVKRLYTFTTVKQAVKEFRKELRSMSKRK